MKKLLYPLLFLAATQFAVSPAAAQKKSKEKAKAEHQTDQLNPYFKAVKWRNVGPSRGGRSVTASGVVNNPLTYYMGTTGGGLWKTEDAGQSWFNISDGFFKTSSVGAVTVSESDPNIVYAGMGEHAVRGVMTSHGDGVYKSTDAGKTWTKLGLDLTRHIAGISVHPQNPDVLYVAAQGALHGPGQERGVYKSVDGGKTWKKTLYVDENTGCADISMDMNNPRILYASMWDHRRLPWQVISGGKGSGLYKSTDAGETWKKLENGLPKELGKIGVSVSRANSNKVYAVIESDTQKELGGLFVSEDGGGKWNRVSKDHRLTQRAWYYIEVFADPQQENTVYVLNAPGLKSTDGGKTWTQITGTHGDYHQLWMNPKDSRNMVVANDGGAAVSFNGGKTWSTQDNQPTAQFYRVNADNLFPYNLYGGQQDNTSVKIASRNTAGGSIGERDWSFSAGGESAFLAFNPDNPRYVVGGSYQGNIEVHDVVTNLKTSIMVSPILYLGMEPKDMKYRFNWNAPIIYSAHAPNTFYNAGNILFKTADMGKTWQAVSPDLTRHDSTKMVISGAPFTNEGAGGENYGTIAYVIESPHEKDVLWTGSDDGLVHLTRDGGKTWSNVTPKGLGETLVNSIEVSPHDKATAYIATTRYKFNDFSPSLYKTTDYGKTWAKITNGIPSEAFTRVVREDSQRKDLLFAGTELGLYVSYDGGKQWNSFQLNLPLTPISDLKIHQGDLIAATQGRSFWILDDLSTIRQYNKNLSATTLHLYQPEDSYRVAGGSALDKVENEESGSGIGGPAGTNPASGVTLYYQLPANFEKDSLVTLEIMDDQGKIVRKYSSKTDKKFVAYPGGPTPDPTLSTKPGLNRFVWDMRYATLPGVPTAFMPSSLTGHKSAPGSYQARLKINGQEKTVAFKVLADPRIDIAPGAFKEQQVVLTALEDGVRDIHTSVLRMRKAKEQVNALVELLEETPDMKQVIDQGKALTKKITAWEDELIQNKSLSNNDFLNYESKLSAHLLYLKDDLDTDIPFVTKAQQERLTELNASWQKSKTDMNELIQKDIANFNQLTKQANLQKITLPGPVTEKVVF
ncbi:glycosyl hydrolase [Rufibacter radiotolerans]|uniref:Glycosyl hydrolase n=1 Tax=Rufibacter radiotolerans TaxID=1379910 RepID=A0A0H4VSS7_9BACT|nr:glycosyl hydrolase [Rufibacter radiotolerans]AKQ47002.1 glycosyl hydrolase [Rufibacter radiotolerans]